VGIPSIYLNSPKGDHNFYRNLAINLVSVNPFELKFLFKLRENLQLHTDSILNHVDSAMQGFRTCEPILIGVSGGADSVALSLSLLKLGYRICLAHMDHAARPDSELDAQWVADWATRHGVEVFVRRRPIPPGDGFEARAREARLKFFQEAARHFGCLVIATGHHQDDQAETVLFRLARGTGPEGLCGIPRQRWLGENMTLVRPLLGLSRRQLEAALVAWGENWREDPSNSSRDYARNRIRHEVLPALNAINPAAGRHIAEAAALMQQEEAHWAAWFEERSFYFARALGPDCLAFDRPSLLSQGLADQGRLVRGWCRRQGWPVPHRAQLQTLQNHLRDGSVADIHGGYRCWVHQEDWVLEHTCARTGTEHVSNGFPLLPVGQQATHPWGWTVCVGAPCDESVSPLRARFTQEILAGGWVWRSARPLEDRFTPQGRTRARSLRHWLSRQGVPSHHQTQLLVLARESLVAWVVGYGVGDTGGLFRAESNCVEMQATTCFQV